MAVKAAPLGAVKGLTVVAVATSVFSALSENSSAQSFPRAGGSRDGHFPCDVKNFREVDTRADTMNKVVPGVHREVSEDTEVSSMVVLSRKTTPISAPLRQLLITRGVYNVREAPASVAQTLLGTHHCGATEAVFNLMGENSMQVRRKPNK